MFLPPEIRPVPRGEPPPKPGRPDLGGDAAVILFGLMVIGPVVAMVIAIVPIVVLVFRIVVGW